MVEILRRKLAKIKFRTQEQFEFDIILALSNICAVDIQTDNVVEARERLRDVVFQFIREQKEEKARKNTIHFLDAIEFVLERTILVGNTLTQKAKLTFYDFKPDRKELVFEISSHSLKDIEETYQKTKKATVKNLCQMVNEFESLTEKSRKVHKKLQKQSPKPESTPDQLQISLLEGES